MPVGSGGMGSGAGRGWCWKPHLCPTGPGAHEGMRNATTDQRHDRPRVLRSDHLHTYLAEGGVMVATLVAYRLAAKLGGDGLDAYILVRRTVSFLQPLLLLGLAVGLPRMVAMAQAHPLQRRYLLAAMRIVLIGSGAGVLFATLMPTTVARALLGDAAMAPVAAPLAWMVLG